MLKSHTIGAERLQKYFLFLTQIYSACQNTDQFSMKKISASARVSNATTPMLQQLGLVKRSGLGPAARWRWVGQFPTMEMASDLCAALERESASRKSTDIPNIPEAPSNNSSAKKLDMVLTMLGRICSELGIQVEIG